MSDRTEFLVEIDLDTGDLDEEAVDRLRAAEAARARELAEDGNLVSLWRIPGRWANYGVWRAADERALREILGTLPLRAYMTIRVQKLEKHPSDPRDAHGLRTHRGRAPLDDLISLEVRGRSTVRTGRGRVPLADLAVLAVRGRGATGLVRDVARPASRAAGTSGAPVTVARDCVWIDLTVDEIADGGDALLHRLGGVAGSALLAVRRKWLGIVNDELASEAGGEGSLVVRASSKSGPIELVTLTRSGALDLDGFMAGGASSPLHLDLGRAVRTPVVVGVPDGGEAIRVQTKVRLCASVRTDLALSANELARIVADIRRQLE